MSGKDTPRVKSHRKRNVVVLILALAASTTFAAIVAGFVYSCSGCGFASAASVSVGPVSCIGTTVITCSAELTNFGNAGTSVVSGTITLSGQQSISGTCQHVTLPSESTTTVKCTFPTSPEETGQYITGFITLSDGSQAPFETIYGQ